MADYRQQKRSNIQLHLYVNKNDNDSYFFPLWVQYLYTLHVLIYIYKIHIQKQCATTTDQFLPIYQADRAPLKQSHAFW